ncbi:LysE family translocator [Prosthecomicrobium pneumaticum]|uniref:Threonine/homoserine/homoserine lactone efflux protein n=1 Tax=Prosthecomicrobium pneumaticum TaxID=81895 RepID=A0A7W9FQJ9_9HYPH|nr:LysE family translocator [Prosthecomicrobium pneumaticum]MBB5755044.1 threonine/homoserine/homoserine lactone efflux protein [Prosthecomicrobium pneumaticum]
METFLSMLGFALVTTATPGPNNMMVMISGANFGLRRSVPHILGIAVGFPVMLLGVGLGLGAVFTAFPLLHAVLKYVAFAWLLYLAWKLARAGRPDVSGAAAAKPLSFLAAAGFQWVNPKAWMMGLSAATLYLPEGQDPLLPLAVLVGLFILATAPICTVWCLFGTAIARLLGTPGRIAAFNWTMAALLVVSMIPTLF